MLRIVLSIIMVTLIWGFSWVPTKVGLSYIPPFLFSAMRLLIGAIPLFILQWILNKPWLPAKRDWGNIVIMSLLMSLGYFGFLTYGMQFIDSGLTSVLVYTMPIIVTLLAHFILRERLTSMKTIGLCMGVIGLLFIVGNQIFRFEFDQTLVGQLLIILAAICWACANIFSKVKFTNIDIITMTSWQLLIGSILLFTISAIAEPITAAQWTFPSIASLLFSGVFATAVTFVAWFWVLGKIEASIASMTLMIVPILGLFFGWLLLDEKLTSNIVIGAIFICFGIFFGSYKMKKRKIKENRFTSINRNCHKAQSNV